MKKMVLAVFVAIALIVSFTSFDVEKKAVIQEPYAGMVYVD